MDLNQFSADDSEFEPAHRTAYLIAAYIQQNLSPAERDELDDWAGASKENLLLFEELTDDDQRNKTLKWFHKLDVEKAKRRVHAKMDIKTSSPFWNRMMPYTVAASVLIIALAAWFYQHQKNSVPVITNKPPTFEPVPGGNKAILTLANGKRIVLDSAANGSLGKEGISTITKNDSLLTYQALANQATQPEAINTIMIPRGGKYQLVLSDGTKVWLNAASSLKYPAVFTGMERRVRLTGEGYFEVAKNKEMPFHVEAAEADITVLGTHFNVRSYEDEEDMETTLLEGSVRVKNRDKQAELKPGEQATVKKGGRENIIVLKNIDTEKVSAWKDGLFVFRNDDLKNIMQSLGNWYDINIVYSSNISRHFSGTFSRKESLSAILKYFEGTNEVHFKMKDKVLTVYP